MSDTREWWQFWRQSSAHQERNNPMRRRIMRPASIDSSEVYSINHDLAKGLWEGSYPGLKLASALAYAPVFVPVSFMGLPIPTSEDDTTQAILDAIVRDKAQSLVQIFEQRRIFGTQWVWPFWTERLRWRFIPDSSVTDILKDTDTEDVIAIVTVEQITRMARENQQEVVTIRREYTKQTVTTDIGASRTIQKNPLGIMPIAFAKDRMGNEKRGKSVYGRILSDLKSYHDVDLRWQQVLAKFNVKMIQTLNANTTVDQWIQNNPQLGPIDEIDIESVDLIFNGQDEKTEFAFPSGVFTAFQQRQAATFWKIVQGTGVPELCWGLIAQGNQSSPEAQMQTLINAVDDDKRQINDEVRELITASARLTAAATMQRVADDIDHKWNKLSGISDDVKSQIFFRFAQGLNSLGASALVTKEQIHRLWIQNFPDATEADFAKWAPALQDMAKFRQFATANYVDAQSAEGQDNADSMDNPGNEPDLSGDAKI